MTQMSSDSARPICSQTPSPSAWMPSSLVIRMRMRRSSGVLDGLAAAHIGLQHVRNCDRAVLLLIVLQHGDQSAADRDAGAVEGVQVAYLTAFPGAVARAHTARLELAADRAGGNFPVSPLPRQPHLDVVGLLRSEAHVAGAQRHHAVMQ